VDNVVVDHRSHLEQAVFANGLSEPSLQQLRQLAAAQWQALQAAMVPALEAMIARDSTPETAPPGPRHRVRLGLYTYQQPEPAPAPTAPLPDPGKPP
jgi:hypothetical protein